MKTHLTVLLTLGLSLGLHAPQMAQAAGPIPEATSAARSAQRQQEVRQVRPDNYDLRQHPPSDWQFWRNLLWTTAIVEPQEAFVADGMTQLLALTTQSNLSSTQKQVLDMAMTIGNQLYLSNPDFYVSIGQQFNQTLAQSPDPYWVAMALSALSKGNSTPEQRQQWSDRVRQRFPNWANDVYLNSTLKEVEAIDQPVALPPLTDLLNSTIAPNPSSNQAIMYVFCRPDRGVLCQTVLKDGKGNFVRENEQLWSVPLLLRSLHNLSSVFTRGQTPQGIYRIEGITPQPDTDYFRAFGLFSLVNLYIPFETSGKLPNTLTAYQSLLPASWRNYFPIQQTYWAGKGDRDSFRIHGTGESPAFFSSNARHASGNWNPSIGCLSALELYDETGRLQQADMPKILGALRAIGGQNFTGYLVVVDVPGDNTPVSLAEIEAAISNVATTQPSNSF
ncbi:MAG: hypothetical protein HY785_27920 [Oscillatoriophycideae cyanobacterium NC_groundwater_1537_Pr4_S-0.65um_50_18]|nr:hypothetical protein [Oscillatoriophycideae cyanobacterium NC_groundwater_1537_Pr4_S-0.65um_50_18]